MLVRCWLLANRSYAVLSLSEDVSDLALKVAGSPDRHVQSMFASPAVSQRDFPYHKLILDGLWKSIPYSLRR